MHLHLKNILSIICICGILTALPGCHPGGESCHAGETRQCTCPSGPVIGYGTQACGADGKWADCLCQPDGGVKD